MADLHRLRLMPPIHVGQRRVVRIDTVVPILIELEAVETGVYGRDDGSRLQWRKVSIAEYVTFAESSEVS